MVSLRYCHFESSVPWPAQPVSFDRCFTQWKWVTIVARSHRLLLRVIRFELS